MESNFSNNNENINFNLHNNSETSPQQYDEFYIQKILDKITQNSLQINPNYSPDEKYLKFIEWLLDNGAIFQDNLDYPVAFGKYNIIGTKAKREISSNEALFYIPKKIMIDS